ncbi:hypothetical protein FNV43_RR18123 [Rhamnella rubrinervis]|uniref:Uncharacterized protein n=1 Tax=Rhamnella rubrinervis TaxID=2594499 RepID=A0A8K0E5M4_9ROSA|nr:hypothetical protein FNV43_RR18123 [Rhamnella rubrinervis]
MGSEAVPEPSSTPKLPLFSIPPPLQSPERPGMLTPPLHSSVSVPFRWEEEPGKPRPCTALTLSNPVDLTPKCLELPPRLLLDTILPSPTTVLEGPYVGRSRFHSSSFRFIGECYGPFSPERGRLGAMVLSKRGIKERGSFGSWRRRLIKGNKEVSGGSYVFPSSVDRESGDGDGDGGNVEETRGGKMKTAKIRRGRSLSSISYPSSHFWATICEGFKHAVSWKSKKLKNIF